MIFSLYMDLKHSTLSLGIRTFLATGELQAETLHTNCLSLSTYVFLLQEVAVNICKTSVETSLYMYMYVHVQQCFLSS